MATGVPVGATLTHKYFTVLYYHGFGAKFETPEDAAKEARARKDRGWEQNLTSNRVYIEERWVMGWHTSGMDIMVDRVEFAPTETREQWLQREQST